jgi:CheY-like chemotaxis protein
VSIDAKAASVAVILVIEDDVDLHRVSGARLEPLGHDLILVETAGDALDRVERKPFDLAGIDLMLPRMDGAESVGKLRGRAVRIALGQAACRSGRRPTRPVPTPQIPPR